jgi:abequosyltransferase
MSLISKPRIGSQPLLTIAIPTYNRANYLDLCLRCIAEELDSLSEKRRHLVKVYVSNNASTDHTDQIMSKYQSIKADEVEYVRNQENIGADLNIVQCYTSAKTPYVWVLGDDDVILPGGLNLVLSVLENTKIDILYVNGYSYSENYLDEPRRGRGRSGVKNCTGALDFVRQTHVMLTFITASIVRSGVDIESVNEATSGTKLLQMGWLLQLVRDGKRFAVIENRIFAAKIGNSGGYGAISVFGNELTNIANSILKNQPALANAIQNGTIVTWFPTYIMDLRKGEAGYLKENIAIDMKRVFGNNWRYYLFLAPLIALPITLAKIYFLLIRLTRKLLGSVLI